MTNMTKTLTTASLTETVGRLEAMRPAVWLGAEGVKGRYNIKEQQ